MGVVIYISSASANNSMKKKQQAVIDFLESKSIPYEPIDLCSNPDAKDVMKGRIPEDLKNKFDGDRKQLLPPQIFNEEVYCGDYDMFFNAREDQLLYTFFKIPPPDSELKTIEDMKAKGYPISFL